MERQGMRALESAADRDVVESALFEIKRVIAGQDEMLERVFVCLLSGGHLLIEGVPGLAKTLTIKTVADILGGTFQRVQFTPDLVPSDLVGTRMYRTGKDEFDTELGPVFCNFLLADEINRAPAKVQSALLEVMQERQVTIGKETHPVPSPFLVMATQNPIESEGTYPLPEAQVDRFMLKVLVDYPAPADELTVIERALAEAGRGRAAALGRGASQRCRPRRAASTSIRRSPATHLDRDGDAEARRERARGAAAYVEYGASPRGPINLVIGARALALLRGRRYALPQDVRELAKDVIRHRLVLSYEALAEGVDAEQDPRPRARDDLRCRSSTSPGRRSHEHGSRTPSRRDPGRPGPGPVPAALLRKVNLTVRRRIDGLLAGDHRSWATGDGTEWPRCGRTRRATTSA